MAPPATLTALLLVLALVPGWFHLHLIERVRPASRATGLNQLLEVVAVGVATTGVSVAATVLVPHRVVPFALDINAWATTGNAYLRWHLQAAVWSLVLTFALALAMAYLLYRVRARGSLEEFKANDSVWMHAIGQRPVGTVPWITLGLSDDSVVEGSLLAYDRRGRREARHRAQAPNLDHAAEPVGRHRASEPRPGRGARVPDQAHHCHPHPCKTAAVQNALVCTGRLVVSVPGVAAGAEAPIFLIDLGNPGRTRAAVTTPARSAAWEKFPLERILLLSQTWLF